MGFKRFVELGRVVLVEYGPDVNKLAVIVDVLDQNKCQIDGPTTGVRRVLINYKRLALTDLKVEGVTRGIKTAELKALLDKDDIVAKFKATTWGRKMENKRKREAMNDFDRFKLMVAKKEKSRRIAKEFKKLKKAHHL
mmetsp:Transcript_14945/g.25953  ORF Transcript_14945/g.25953 Transcript_14945/m.25953 type:complete len:138 (+) Transcript_14945:110-523(+)|eukprot:CAMPEP_0184691682 /NCGR_PEP_ID=MMETSP0313-20130426/454_1 /TAXON_ID=2792 /ORGANISM="Porphyridium aerugineum, Strain SAG 1380-2" /LENGTH=137 /DNA_ID=CAMNT_0027149439 /DNA_START=90 /DNA_END=503 /DNA_ORIENTATION=+